ncbi:winged helix DNA-binding domain-containing protein [Lacisediminihabitans profunda]|uniref:Winged helix DNA-binding domain-containing protein n=1 Tax=Lacisediminihabitans profunda TaxID=2594790 RepID=A0A5C8UPL7_9MICO|nr:winged helix DNA-binding domain-containing protein [Lacisediminihabitans profunda]TXN30229.1 winged helix DNA-binding domain-containing protein [Lacisediminihabitans profunda]
MATPVSANDLLRMRLTSQLIGGSSLAPAAVVTHMLATQAQDFAQALWAIGVRSPGSTRSSVLGSLRSGDVVRSWPFRGTLMFVPAEDLGWMLGISAHRALSAAAARHRTLELDDAALSEARDLTVAALEGGRMLGRDDYFALLESHGIRTTGQRGVHIIWVLAQTGVVCWGPPLGTQQGLVLVDEWVGSSRVLGRDEALRELVVRYFAGHGPATLKDLAWWAKGTVADLTLGIALAGDALEQLSHEGTAYWRLAGAPDPSGWPALTMLPGFDEYLLGYQARDLPLAVEHSQKIVPGNNGVFLPTIVVNGRVVGTWKRAFRGASITVTPEPFAELSAANTAALERATKRYTSFFAG